MDAIEIDDIITLRKTHPCGGSQWKVVRLGADIGLECLKCGHRILLPRRDLARRMKGNPVHQTAPEIQLTHNDKGI